MQKIISKTKNEGRIRNQSSRDAAQKQLSQSPGSNILPLPQAPLLPPALGQMQPPRKRVIDMEIQKKTEARDACSFSFALLHFYVKASTQKPYTFVHNVHKMFKESSGDLFF